MKFGHEYEQALANEQFPQAWLGSAIDYKNLKKVIKKVKRELQAVGLDANTLRNLTQSLEEQGPDDQRTTVTARRESHDFKSATESSLATIPEEFSPQLRILVDSKTGAPLDAKLAPATKIALQKLAQHEIVTAGRREHLGDAPMHALHAVKSVELDDEGEDSPTRVPQDARWVQLPLTSAKIFFDLLSPKLEELERLREAETTKLEGEIFDLGEALENVIQPVREGFEAKRDVSYRDLYFWREMFRLYIEDPVFYSQTEQNGGAINFAEAKKRLEAYDERLRATGLLAKMKTPRAQQAAKQFLDLNVDILRIMHFQEMNAKAMTKILKKFDKRTHLEGESFLTELRTQYPALVPNASSASKLSAGGFADSIARDLHLEIQSKVLAVVPQLDDWNCPVCYQMAWRPVNLGCCRSVFCSWCIIKMQDKHMERCPTCNAETVLRADGSHIDFEAMYFLQKYFPMETKQRQKENERESLVREYGEEFVKPSCGVM